MKRICLIAVMVLLSVCVQQVWAAPPGLPSTFYGSVRIDKVSVPVGTYVSARIGATTYKRVQVQQDPTHGVVYAMDIPADDPTTPGVEGGKDGDTVVFIAELPNSSKRTMLQRGTWRSGGSMELHLSTWVSAVVPLILSFR